VNLKDIVERVLTLRGKELTGLVLEDGSRVVARDDNRRCYTNPMITMVKKPLHPEIAALTLAMTIEEPSFEELLENGARFSSG